VHKRQFYANTTFSGTPKKTDCDATVDENWGTKAPASGLPKDNFGVRWTVTRDFGSGGPFALPVAAQDGLRVYLDGTRKVDLWKNVSSTVKKTVNVTIPSGKHTLRVDYADWTGAANVTFGYTPAPTPPSTRSSPSRRPGLPPRTTPQAATPGRAGRRTRRWTSRATASTAAPRAAPPGRDWYTVYRGELWGDEGDEQVCAGTPTGVKADGTETLPAGDWTVTGPAR
jgi:hypothetical protein